MTSRHEQFKNQNYINLETFRKSGEGVKTPAWFVQEGENLFVRTEAGSWKVKRLRNNGAVRVAPCTATGELRGEWVNAVAVLVDGEDAQKVDDLLSKKYGLMKKLFDIRSVFQKTQPATIRIELKS